jgi:hypothetical protein
MLMGRILFVGGSLNQTTMMHRIAERLPEHEHAFSPLYASGVVGYLARKGRLDVTVLGGQGRRRTLEYFEKRSLPVDEGGQRGPYDLVVLGTDLIVAGNLKKARKILVQEGMTDPEDWRYHLVRALGLPRYLANTSMTGLSHTYEAFCVASDGYRDLFLRKGVKADRMVVTGIPNFDDAAALRDNDLPDRGYVLAATSCLRETFKREDRKGFIAKSVRIADGRPLFFKLHPNENVARASREIRDWAPGARILSDGNTGHLIANSDVLVTKYSSVVYLAVALGKEVHADVDIGTLRRLMPVQNGGRSAAHIADVCRRSLR